jgi:hypothetical protein
MHIGINKKFYIIIVIITHDFINNFSFDPNEELKLRSIIAAVGIEEFNACVKQMANIVVTKSKQSTRLLTCMKLNR